MIIDFFYSLINDALAALPVPEAPSWVSSGLSLPTAGIVSASVLNVIAAFWLALLLLRPAVWLIRRVVSLITLGGGAA